MSYEKANADIKFFAEVIRGGLAIEAARASGKYYFECYGRDGKLKWREECDNLVTTVGKNYALNTFLQASSFSVIGPYLGLIGLPYTSGPAITDTMGSHAGWSEVGLANAPAYTAPRKSVVGSWAAASNGSKSLSSAASYAITSAGTVKGAFLVLDSGALSNIDNTGGTLYSAGTFTDKVVGIGDTLNVSYTAQL